MKNLLKLSLVAVLFASCLAVINHRSKAANFYRDAIGSKSDTLTPIAVDTTRHVMVDTSFLDKRFLAFYDDVANICIQIETGGEVFKLKTAAPIWGCKKSVPRQDGNRQLFYIRQNKIIPICAN